MSDGELFVTFAAIVTVAILWFPWLIRATASFAPSASRALRLTAIVAPFSLLIALIAALRVLATLEVKESVGYLALFTASGAITLYAASAALKYLGLDVLGNGVEAGNPSVVVAVVGMWTGTTAANIGANVGNGETIATTLVPLGAGMLLLIAFAILVAWCTQLPNTITGSRSIPAGLRFGALNISAGLLVARAAAGDWVSWEATMADISRAIPLLAAVGSLGWFGERTLPSASSGKWTLTLLYGILPALAYISSAVLLASRGWT